MQNVSDIALASGRFGTRHMTDDIVESPPRGFCDVLINPANEVPKKPESTESASIRSLRLPGPGWDSAAILSDESRATSRAPEFKARVLGRSSARYGVVSRGALRFAVSGLPASTDYRLCRVLPL